MALAFDFSKDPKYLEGVNEGMNYLLGRNPLDQSYVTGYGERPLEHPHHRFWAHQANASFPSPPAGAISGGPNSGLQDPYVQAAGLAGCAPEKCFIDNIEAWSANEIAINWNSPLAWTAAFLDEKANAPAPAKTASRERMRK
jgi:endoglucanase